MLKLKKFLQICNVSSYTRTFCSINGCIVDNSFNLDASDKPETTTKKSGKSRQQKVIKYFKNVEHLKDVLELIPSDHFSPKRRLKLQHLYLVDKIIAKDAVLRILPHLLETPTPVICETNVGLGFITAELFKNGIKHIRLYETCPEFRNALKVLFSSYVNKIELYVRDIFSLGLLTDKDKYDNENRVEQLLQGIPRRPWNSNPVMTIIGPMPNTKFIYYLLNMVSIQQGITCHGRIQMFAFIKPLDYFKFTATTGTSLHIYQVISVLFQLFFDCEFIAKYPRKSFLPWETHPNENIIKRYENIEEDIYYMYLVRITQKKELPVKTCHLLHLMYFIKQGFRRGRPKVIPTVEKWLPGIGVNLIVPNRKYLGKCYQNMTIFTEFGQLTPTQILHVFLEMVHHPEFNKSPFIGLIESELIKTETIETDLYNDQSVV